MKTKAFFQAIIIGGGVPGLTTAILLGQAGLSCALIDMAELPSGPLPKPGTRTIALMDSSLNVIKACGAWDDLKPHGAPLKTLSVIDDSSLNVDPLRVDFHARDAGMEAFGYNVANNIIHAVLSKHARACKNITLLTPARVKTIQTEPNVEITLEDGQVIQGDVLIGADGRGSIVRRHAGIDVSERDYGQMAMTCLLTHTRPHHETSVEHHRPGGPFTFVPMHGNRSALVWVEKTEEAQKLLKLKKDDFEQAIQDRSRGLLGKITLEGTPDSAPLKLLYAKSLVALRTALVAEAAHVMSPIGAQGLNLSLRDVAALAETLIDGARVGLDIGAQSVLQNYQNRRRVDIASRIHGVDGFNRIVSNNLVFLRGFRRAGLRSLSAIPPLKKFVMHQGLVPMLDDARILRGEVL